MLCAQGWSGAAEEPGSRVSIWKVSGEQAEVYLAGSVHLLRESDLPVPAAYDEVYELADEVVFELDMAEVLSPATAIKVQSLGALPSGERLDERLGEGLMERLRGYLRERSLPPATMDRFHPGMAYLTLGSLEAMRHGARPEFGLEVQYYRKAVADGKPTGGLETIEDQIGRLLGLEDALVSALIEETLDEAGGGPEILDRIVAAWREGDEEGLAELVVDKMDLWPEVRQTLLIERNENWIEPIERSLGGDRCVLFLVGAAHLVGEGSVIDLLERRGHRPEQLAADSILAAREETEPLAETP